MLLGTTACFSKTEKFSLAAVP